jgi:DNA-binding XRE family transcriptional regulator
MSIEALLNGLYTARGAHTDGNIDEMEMTIGHLLNDLMAELGGMVQEGGFTGSSYGTALWHFNEGYRHAAANGQTSLTEAQMEAAEIRFARNAKRLTQQQLGDSAGVPNWVISDWEHARHKPTATERAKVGAALGLDLTMRSTPQMKGTP